MNEIKGKWVTEEREVKFMTMEEHEKEHQEKLKHCDKSPDGKHRFKYSSFQHAMMYHSCYECVFCGFGHCVNTSPPEIDPMSLPTIEDLQNI